MGTCFTVSTSVEALLTSWMRQSRRDTKNGSNCKKDFVVFVTLNSNKSASRELGNCNSITPKRLKHSSTTDGKKKAEARVADEKESTRVKREGYVHDVRYDDDDDDVKIIMTSACERTRYFSVLPQILFTSAWFCTLPTNKV
jgi:hypothetical protein